MCEIAKKQEQKAKAIEILKELDIYKPYIEGFEQEDRVCFFEGFGGYWVDQEPEVLAKMKEVEEQFNCTVYAITHEYTQFGECWSFLYISQYTEDWQYLCDKVQPHIYYVASYVWNKDDEICSEFGDIVVKSFGGGITRIG